MDNRLRYWRQVRGLSQSQLAAAARLHQPTISALETGAAKIWPGQAARLAAVLNCEPTDLL
jgi:transcriptional regulator with XRE-family HTH domain